MPSRKFWWWLLAGLVFALLVFVGISILLATTQGIS